jgi:hypothetical protein
LLAAIDRAATAVQQLRPEATKGGAR